MDNTQYFDNLKLSANQFLSKVGARFSYLTRYFIDRYRYQFKLNNTNKPTSLFVNEALRNLNKFGYHKVEGFLTPVQSNNLKNKLERAIEINPEFVHSGSSYDSRIFGIENFVAEIQAFTNHAELELIASLYLNDKAKTGFTLGAKLQAVPGNLGSGGGWHRDSDFRQFKAMIYLSDVEESNGPFQFIADSHKPLQVIKDNAFAQRGHSEVRWNEKLVEDLLNSSKKERLQSFTAKAGTLLLFDSSAIHRGAPIANGIRFALTNYYFKKRFLNSSIYDHFYPVAGHSTVS